MNTKLKIITALIIIGALYEQPLAQNDGPLTYFPHKTGNLWEYYDVVWGYPPDTVQSAIVRDSVDSAGSIFCTRAWRWIRFPNQWYGSENFKIDTSFNVWHPEDYLRYKLNARQGDQWVALEYPGGNGYEMVRVPIVREGVLFGIQTTFKTFVYYFAQDSTDTLGLTRYGETLAKGFGLVWRGGGDAFYDYYLKGCVINGRFYGDTTLVNISGEELLSNLPEQFILYPNYPNPFNSNTIISFKLNSPQNISLIIYDAMGKEVARLIDTDFYYSGDYKISWDGKNSSNQLVSSGVYYYQLRANRANYTRPMILIK